MKILGNVLEILDNIRLANPNSDETKVRQLLQEYGISGIAEREIKSGGYELSGGERQKISIIRAMIKDTPVVFIDEPENNLDITAIKSEGMDMSQRQNYYLCVAQSRINCLRG